MYKVCFNGVTVAQVNDVNDSVLLALNLNRSSNVERTICVFFKDDVIVRLSSSCSSNE